MSYLPVPIHNPPATSFKTIAAAAVALVLANGPVSAQAAIQEPGMFSFYHPDLDVLNGGPRTPATRLIVEPRVVMRAHAAGKNGFGSARAQRHRFYR
jgi:hypothetical protein